MATGINDFLLKPYTIKELEFKVLENMTETKTMELPQANQKVNASTMQYKGVCLDQLMADCQNDSSVLQELVRLFKQNVFEFMGAVRIHLVGEDYKAIALAAHKIKAGLAMIRAKEQHAIVLALEKNAKNGNKTDIEKSFELFIKNYLSLEKLLDTEVQQLTQK